MVKTTVILFAELSDKELYLNRKEHHVSTQVPSRIDTATFRIRRLFNSNIDPFHDIR